MANSAPSGDGSAALIPREMAQTASSNAANSSIPFIELPNSVDNPPLTRPKAHGMGAAVKLCRECGNARDRRIGHDLLRLAARAGDRRAQRELGQVED